LSDTDGAFASLRQSIYCDPNFLLAYYALGELYERSRQYTAALRQWKLAQKITATLDPKAQLMGEDDLTVEMMQSLLEQAIARLPGDA
jgi:chemotaxis protein methyltransferase CheR